MPELGTGARLKRDVALAIKLLLILALAFYLYQVYLEAGLIILSSALLIIAWQLLPTWFGKAQAEFGRLARRRRFAITLAGLISLGVSAWISSQGSMPRPRIHDEFSYLLAADTFLHGRLANPTHPMWTHFETIHVIFQPTYSSKYPPAQGLVLAAGRLIGGHAIVGVWLSCALACAAICWMLMVWLGPRWGFLGGLIVAIHPLALAWSQNYWGGAISMGGGALLCGGFRRVLRRPRARDAWIMGAGMAITAFHRPFEGGVLSATLILILVVKWVRTRTPVAREWIKSTAAPLIVVAVFTVTAWGYFDFRVTGHILQMPAMLHEKTYAVSQTFLWQSPNPEPVYRHKAIRDYQMEWSLGPYLAQRSSFSGFIAGAREKIELYSDSYFQGCAAILLVALCFIGCDRRVRLIFGILIPFAAALLAATWAQPHYAAPAAGLLFVLSFQTLRRMNRWKIGAVSIGAVLTRVSLILLTASLISSDIHLPRPTEWGWSADRSRLLARLTLQEGKQLVIVRYGREHDCSEEWVYNEADIDRAKVVWARDMGVEQNRELLNYFNDRTAWLLQPEAPDREFEQYDEKAEEANSQANASQIGGLVSPQRDSLAPMSRVRRSPNDPLSFFVQCETAAESRTQ